jgi:hypothetical protein
MAVLLLSPCCTVAQYAQQHRYRQQHYVFLCFCRAAQLRTACTTARQQLTAFLSAYTHFLSVQTTTPCQQHKDSTERTRQHVRGPGTAQHRTVPSTGAEKDVAACAVLFLRCCAVLCLSCAVRFVVLEHPTAPGRGLKCLFALPCLSCVLFSVLSLHARMRLTQNQTKNNATHTRTRTHAHAHTHTHTHLHTYGRFFDITIDGEAAGRIVFELYMDKTPKTAEVLSSLSSLSLSLSRALLDSYA